MSIQANGLDERFNRTLQNMIVKFVSASKKDWSCHIDTCVYAYKTSKHDSSKYTPFQLMFGHQAILPVDLALESKPFRYPC